MSSDLASLIQLGHDLTSHKYHSLATGMVLFYDYFLTVGDEIEYVWFERKTFGSSALHTLQISTRRCDKTAWYSLFAFVFCTVLAQAMLTLRIYAVMMKNLPTTIGLAVIAASQFVLGLWATIRSGQRGAQVLPQIPLDAFHLCVFSRDRTLEVAYTSTSLLFDFLAFSLIILWVERSKARNQTVATILDTIAEDSTWYFLLIFSSHFALVMTLNFGRVSVPLSLTELQLTVTISYLSSQIYSFFQLRKSPTSYPI
ncbi:hypothetical protein BJ322DRAFT_549293 [Thelephora terrestris]|uniref:DUF6533 domain-containing protein n=1 Tax=Thelephora terrestris TaxID=56493 RepID=A0A9P6HP25_9AGAM|nr:hypothetical protein BJ322DRAFT_549293 [Thelephora terrestris]